MAWPRDAYVGQKVVCIDGEWEYSDPGENVVEGGVYEIEKITVSLTHEWNGSAVYFDLKGCALDQYSSECFRPVDPASKKADRGLAALKDGIKTVREREEA